MSNYLYTTFSHSYFHFLQLLGVLWNWCLYGALIVQFCERQLSLTRLPCLYLFDIEDVYSYNFSQDDKRIKFLGREIPHRHMGFSLTYIM